MSLKWVTIAIVVLMVGLGFVGWKQRMQPAVQEPATGSSMPPDVGAVGEAVPADPGLQWEAPPGWTSESGSAMRIATYTVPAAGSGPTAQCAVYYFGPGQGGTPEANIARWFGEFDHPRDPQRSTRVVHGLRVTRARVRGGYQSHGGSGGPQSVAEGGDQQLLGAIVEGPDGPVFFKLTGPTATIDRAATDFDRMIASVRKK